MSSLPSASLLLALAAGVACTASTPPSCRPPAGTTYLTIGQDLFSINEYVTSQYNASLHNGSLAPLQSFYPAAFMFYTDLDKLRGLDAPIDYGSGVEFADGVLTSLFPGHGVGMQVGLWLGGSKGCNKINNGLMDGQIAKLIKYVQNCEASKVFLRLGYEFDNPSFLYSDNPPAYAKAFRKIVLDFRQSLSAMELSKVQFVWHSWAAPRAKGVDLKDFYPGDDYVDWVGVSIFQQVYPWSEGLGGRLSDVDKVMQFASQHGKPTMIAESTPFGGIDMITNETIAFDKTDPWDRWFNEVIAFIDEYDVSMFSYINCDWESQPMWHNIGFGETRISSNQRVMEKWRDLIISGNGKRKFLMAGSLVNCGGPTEAKKGFSILIVVVCVCSFLVALFFAWPKRLRVKAPSAELETTTNLNEESPMLHST